MVGTRRTCPVRFSGDANPCGRCRSRQRSRGGTGRHIGERRTSGTHGKPFRGVLAVAHRVRRAHFCVSFCKAQALAFAHQSGGSPTSRCRGCAHVCDAEGVFGVLANNDHGRDGVVAHIHLHGSPGARRHRLEAWATGSARAVPSAGRCGLVGRKGFPIG